MGPDSWTRRAYEPGPMAQSPLSSGVKRRPRTLGRRSTRKGSSRELPFSLVRASSLWRVSWSFLVRFSLERARKAAPESSLSSAKGGLPGSREPPFLPRTAVYLVYMPPYLPGYTSGCVSLPTYPGIPQGVYTSLYASLYTHLGVYTSLYASLYTHHPGYTLPTTTLGTRLVMLAPRATGPPRARDGALGSKRQKSLGERHFSLF